MRWLSVSACVGDGVVLTDLAERLWRVAATGFAFASFGLGGSFLAAMVFPPLALLTGANSVARARAQRVVRASFRLFVWMLQALGILRLEVTGRERLSACRGRLIVANHPTLLDVVLLMSLVPRVQCIVKHQLWKNPFLGGVVRAAGYIRNDLDPEALIDACRAALAAGDNLIVFPEGTRSQPGRTPSFRRGFANIAALTGADVQMVVITCEPLVLTKGEPWYRVPARRPLLRVSAGECVSPASLGAGPYRGRTAREVVRLLDEYYARRLANG